MTATTAAERGLQAEIDVLRRQAAFHEERASHWRRRFWAAERRLEAVHDSLAEAGTEARGGDGSGVNPEKCDSLAADITAFLDGEGE